MLLYKKTVIDMAVFFITGIQYYKSTKHLAYKTELQENRRFYSRKN